MAARRALVLVAISIASLSGWSPPATAQTPSEEVIAQIRVEGQRRLSEEMLRRYIGSRVGQAYDEGQLADDVRELFGLGFFRDVQVRREPTAEGLVVTFEVEEHPIIGGITILGNTRFEQEVVRDALTLNVGIPAAPRLIQENLERILSLYESMGYYGTEVDARLEAIKTTTSRLILQITENERPLLREIRFVGNQHLDDDELMEEVQHTLLWKPWGFLAAWLDLPEPGRYHPAVFVQDLRRIEDRYGSEGFLRVSIAYPELEVDSDELRLEVKIDEGPRYTVGTVELHLDGYGDAESLRSALRLVEGGVFDVTLLREGIHSLEELYANRGFEWVSVLPRTALRETGEVVDVRVEIQTGERNYRRFFSGVLQRTLR